MLALVPGGLLHAEPGDRVAAPAPATAPAAQRSSGDPIVDQLLDRLEARGRSIQGLSTRLEYRDVRTDPVPEEILRRGELLFRRLEPNPKFLIVFHETIAGGVVRNDPESFVFDGQWFVERHDRSKQIIRRQVVRPGERIDPFRVGQGPFPLPFGQTRADMLANFVITRKPQITEEIADSDRLDCVPRPESDLARKYRAVSMWIDRKLDLPVRIQAERIADDTILDVTFSKLNPHDAPAESRFRIDRPPGPDWEVREEPLPDRPAEPPGRIPARESRP